MESFVVMREHLFQLLDGLRISRRVVLPALLSFDEARYKHYDMDFVLRITFTLGSVLRVEAGIFASEPGLPGQDNRLRPATRAQLAVDATDVIADRLGGNDRAPGDLVIAKAKGDKLEDFTLAWGELGEDVLRTGPFGFWHACPQKATQLGQEA